MALDQDENDQTGRVSPVSTAFDGAGFANNTSLAQAGFRAKDAKMNASDIKDEKSLRQWLETRPQADSGAIAHRAALRVAPIWLAAMASDWAYNNKFTELTVLRLLLAAGVTGKYQNQKTKAITRSAFSAAVQKFGFAVRAGSSYDAITAARSSAGFAARFAYAAAPDSFILAVDAAFAASIAARSSAPAIWGVVKIDCNELENGQQLDARDLWHNLPNSFQHEWSETRARWAISNSPYAFWLRWYEAALKGNSLNPELERDIALIPDADWEKGAEHVAVIIAQIEERHDLKAQVVALREQLTLIQAEAATAAHRSHNQPPELLDAAPELQRQITIIFDALDEAETELSQTAPAPSRLKRIGQALMDAIIAIAKYCGGIANKAIVAAAVAGGTAVGGLGVAKLLELSAPTQTLGQSILDYASRLIGG